VEGSLPLQAFLAFAVDRSHLTVRDAGVLTVGIGDDHWIISNRGLPAARALEAE
jgi:hypothetical protein